MKRIAAEAEIQRDLEKGPKKQEYRKVRREQKMKKRNINIEICSEILDLIMDVADEAFEY